MSKERRIHPRTETRIASALRSERGEVAGIVENLGAGGVFFSTGDLEVLFEVGDVVAVVLTSDEAGTTEHKGTVLRAERYFDGADVRRSFAIKFDAEIEPSSLGIGG